MGTAALKVPAGGWKAPGWATPHNLALIAVAVVVVLVIFGLLRVMHRLARATEAAAARTAAPAAVPPPAAKPRTGRTVLIGAVAAVGGLLAWRRLGHGTAASPAPAPTTFSPSPKPTVTVTAKPSPAPAHHFNLPHFAIFSHLTGTDWVLIVLIGAVFTFAAVRPLLRRSS